MSLYQQNTLLLLGICLMASFCLSCRKDPRIPFCEEFPQDCIDITTVKDHFYFDEGTYWVYQEENSGQIDSQWVSQAHTEPNVCWFSYRIESSLIEHHFNISTDLLSGAIDSGLVSKTDRTILISRSKTKAGDFVGSSYLAPFYYEVNDSVGNWGGTNSVSYLWIETILKHFSLTDYQYKDVLKIVETHNISEHKQPTVHYYAEHVGLIRKELLDSNQVWNLIRYHIKQ